MKLRFKKINEFDEFEVTLPDGHRIEKYMGWNLNGGEQFYFRCTCGWSGRNGSYRPKSNHAAETHARRSHKKS